MVFTFLIVNTQRTNIKQRCLNISVFLILMTGEPGIAFNCAGSKHSLTISGIRSLLY